MAVTIYGNGQGIVQVVQTVITSGFSTNSGSYVDITGLTATITPKSASNKILVVTNFFAGSNEAPYPKFQLLRNGTNIFQGDANGAGTRQSACMVTGATQGEQQVGVPTYYLDSPATTSAVTYKWQVYTFLSRVIYIGKSQVTVDANASSTPSTITLMEVAYS